MSCCKHARICLLNLLLACSFLMQGAHVAAVGPASVSLSGPASFAGTGCSDPPDTSGIHTDFEDGALDGWTPRIGEEILTVTSADEHSGSFSLLITNRQRTYSGPSIDATGKMCNGSRYRLSLWAKLAAGEPDAQLRLSLQRSLRGTVNFNALTGNTIVTANEWVQLTA